MWQAWTNGVLGIWLIIAAFLPMPATGNMWNNLIVGIIVAVAGFGMISKKSWQGWLAGIMGLWLIVAAFIPALQMHSGNLWNDLISGILIATAGFAALSSGETHHTTHQPAH